MPSESECGYSKLQGEVNFCNQKEKQRDRKTSQVERFLQKLKNEKNKKTYPKPSNLVDYNSKSIGRHLCKQ